VEPQGNHRSRQRGLVLLVGFFTFGAIVAGLTAVMLLAPGSWAEPVWRLKPTAQEDFRALGVGAVPLMVLVAVACAGAAVGLWRGRWWGYRLAVGVLGINLIGDVANALLRNDWRALIGVPIGGALLFYMMRSSTRDRFFAAG
jgi:hypothetical protein